MNAKRLLLTFGIVPRLASAVRPLITGALLIVTLSLAAQDASAILNEADSIFELNNVYSRNTMFITRSGRAQAPQVMEGYESDAADGTPRSFTVFTDPPRVDGTAYLMIGDDLWIRFASTGRIRKMSSSARKNSAGGSDFSYADMGEGSKSFSAQYTAIYDGEERINGTACHRLILTPRTGERDAYEMLIAWITRETNSYLRIEYHDKGAPIKVMDLEDYRSVGGIEYPFRITMRSLARDSISVIETELLEFDSPKVEERFFSTAYLESIR